MADAGGQGTEAGGMLNALLARQAHDSPLASRLRVDLARHTAAAASRARGAPPERQDAVVGYLSDGGGTRAVALCIVVHRDLPHLADGQRAHLVELVDGRRRRHPVVVDAQSAAMLAGTRRVGPGSTLLGPRSPGDAEHADVDRAAIGPTYGIAVRDGDAPAMIDVPLAALRHHLEAGGALDLELGVPRPWSEGERAIAAARGASLAAEAGVGPAALAAALARQAIVAEATSPPLVVGRIVVPARLRIAVTREDLAHVLGGGAGGEPPSAAAAFLREEESAVRQTVWTPVARAPARVVARAGGDRESVPTAVATGREGLALVAAGFGANKTRLVEVEPSLVVARSLDPAALGALGRGTPALEAAIARTRSLAEARVAGRSPRAGHRRDDHGRG